MTRIPSSSVLAAVALAGSVAAHMAFGVWQGGAAPQTVETEGGGGAEIAVQGTSFADLAAGVSSAVVPQTMTAVTSAVTTMPVQSVAPVTPVAAPVASTPVTARAVVSPAAQATASVEETTPRVSVRPLERSADVKARAAAQAPKQAAKQPYKAAKKPAAQRGNAQNNATRGTSGGSSTAKAASSGTGKQQAAGTAAASNYPGQVQRRIARQRLPRVRAQGVAQVSFTIAPGGSLASIGLARSSGSAELDREAVNLVRRAAPFPPPPQGAQRSFTIPVRAR